MVHGLVQPRRADRGDRGDRLRARDLRDGAPQLLVRLPEHQGVRLPHVCRRPPRRARPEPHEGHSHGDAEHDLGLLAHDRRRRHRGRAVRSCRTITVVQLDLHGHGQRHGLGWRGGTGRFGSIVFWYVFLTGLLMAQYTITGFDASAHMAEETHQASRSAAVGMYMSVVASVFFGFILLVAVTSRMPSTEPTDRPLHHPDELGRERWARAGGQSCSSSAASRSSSASRRRSTSASRMLFAFSRDRAVPGHQLWRRVASQPRAAHTPSSRSSSRRPQSCCRRSTTSSSATTSAPGSR